jgi:hypothetical protein
VAVFDLDHSRLRYLTWLRQARRRSARSDADHQHTLAKASLLQLRIAEKKREMIMLDEAIETTEEIVGLFLTKMSSLPARLGGHDLLMRRRIDEIIFEMRTEVADMLRSSPSRAARRGRQPRHPKHTKGATENKTRL